MSLSRKEFENLNEKENLLREAANILSVEEKDLPRVIERFLKEIEEMKAKTKT
jgi:alanyl-tRNA synthetase